MSGPVTDWLDLWVGEKIVFATEPVAVRSYVVSKSHEYRYTVEDIDVENRSIKVSYTKGDETRHTVLKSMPIWIARGMVSEQ